MTFSIRTKLTFWYVSLLTVSLLFFGMAFSYSLFKIFMYRIDNQISSVANMMVHTVIKPSGQLFLPQDFDIILERFFGIRTAGNYIQVLDPHGQVVAKSSNLESRNLPLTGDTYASAVKGLTTYEVIRKRGTNPIRLVTVPIFLHQKRLVAVVQVGSSLEGMDEIFHSLAYIYVIGIVACVVTAGGVGSFLARKALKPVAEITKMARKIGAENLNERINIRGPKDEIGMLASTINEMIGRLEKSFKQIKQFTGDASHELKTPLTILKGEMEIALRSKDDVEAMREALKSSLEEIDRMSYIVRNLLDLAKMDVEREATAGETVNLDRIVADRFEHFRRFALDSGVDMAILMNRPVIVHGNPIRLSQLVYNLIDNALKYTQKGGSVRLSLEDDGEKAILKVEDTGVGISGDDVPYIFDRFYRVDKARTRDAGGVGLGLSICKEIAESHEGTIEVVSEPGRGSAFIVRLPLATARDNPLDL